jgi:3-demethylubiquinone-9 3-methyltransferase
LCFIFISYTFDPLHAYKTVIHMILPICKNCNMLWFYDKTEQAAKFYTSIFKNSKIGDITLYGNEGYYMEMKDTRFMGGRQDL